MARSEGVLQELDDLSFGLQLVWTIGAFDVLRHLFSSHVRPQTIVRRGRMLYQLSEGADIFVSGVRNIQAGWGKVKLLGRHSFRGFHHVLFVLTHLAVHQRSKSGWSCR